MTRTRTYSEVALCHLPDIEISWVRYMIEEGLTCAYDNEVGFFIWAGVSFINDTCPVLVSLLNKAETDYVLFDADVEPDPELETYDV